MHPETMHFDLLSLSHPSLSPSLPPSLPPSLLPSLSPSLPSSSSFCAVLHCSIQFNELRCLVSHPFFLFPVSVLFTLRWKGQSMESLLFIQGQFFFCATFSLLIVNLLIFRPWASVLHRFVQSNEETTRNAKQRGQCGRYFSDIHFQKILYSLKPNEFQHTLMSTFLGQNIRILAKNGRCLVSNA